MCSGSKLFFDTAYDTLTLQLIKRAPTMFMGMGMMPQWKGKALLCICVVLAHIKLGSSFLSNVLPRNLSLENLHKLPTHATASLRATTAASAAPDTLLVPPGILGPPEPLRSLKVGQYVNAFRAVHGDNDGEEEGTAKIQFTIERVSHTPDIFHLQNFVTPSECAQIISAAEESGMEQAGTVSKNDDTTSRKECSVAWISSSNGQGDDSTSSSSKVVSDLMSSTANIFLSRDVLSHPSAGAEDLQVLKYGPGGEFIHHHDGEPRTLTVIYYINGVGGTWFPLARTNNDDTTREDSDEREPKNKAQALDLVKDLEPGKNGLLVKGSGQNNKDSNNARVGDEDEHIAQINPGDAIAFYNYKDDGSAQLDWRSVHCALPTTEEEGTKWIANHWFRVNVLAEM